MHLNEINIYQLNIVLENEPALMNGYKHEAVIAHIAVILAYCTKNHYKTI